MEASGTKHLVLVVAMVWSGYVVFAIDVIDDFVVDVVVVVVVL